MARTHRLTASSIDEAARRGAQALGRPLDQILVRVLADERRRFGRRVVEVEVTEVTASDARTAPRGPDPDAPSAGSTTAASSRTRPADDPQGAPTPTFQGAPEPEAPAPPTPTTKEDRRVSDEPEDTPVDEDDQQGEALPEETPEERMARLDREADIAADFIEGLLDILDLPGDIDIEVTEEQATVTVQDVGSGLLIGRRGATLDALQELVRCTVQRETERRSHVRVDVEGYRERQLEKLRDKCRDAIAEVRESGQPVKLEPMDAFERKMMHDLAAAASGVTSMSEGTEPRRRVVIMPE